VPAVRGLAVVLAAALVLVAVPATSSAGIETIGNSPSGSATGVIQPQGTPYFIAKPNPG